MHTADRAFAFQIDQIAPNGGFAHLEHVAEFFHVDSLLGIDLVEDDALIKANNNQFGE